MNRVLAIWLPNWPLQRLIASRPELAGRPVVLQTAARRGQCVAACSREATALGVEVGMPAAEALALVFNSCGGAELVLAHDSAADRAALVELAQWCHRYSPTVGWEESETPETLLLDATNLAPLYGGEEALVRQADQGMKRRGLAARIALADAIAAAWAVAHAGDRGCCIVPRGRTRDALATLPLAALRLPAELLDALVSLGIERVGHVLDLPRDQLRSRFGPQLLLRVDQALGAVRETMVAVAPPEEFVVEEEFEFPLADRGALEQVVEQLAARLASLLRLRCAGALAVACRCRCEGSSPVELAVGLFQPSASARHLHELLQLEMERVRLPSSAIAVELRAIHHAPLAERQATLFDGDRSLANSGKLATLVDRLAGRLGRDAVLRCRLASDAQPELACREEPLVGMSRPTKQTRRSAASQRLAAIAAPSSPGPLDRPLCLLRPPAAVEALSVAPDGPPIQFLHAGQRYEIACHKGPERIETGWWRRRTAARDYYRVETSEGRRFWLFRELRTGKWFLHGAFE